MADKKRICVIDNTHCEKCSSHFPQFPTILQQLQMDHAFDFDIIPHHLIDQSNLDSFDGFILSGSKHNLSQKEVQELFSAEIDLVRATDKPVLGICFGHQLIAKAHGFPVVKMKCRHEKDDHELKLTINNKFFLCDKDNICVQLDHEEEVLYSRELEEVFDVIASSEHCRVQIMKHKSKPHIGIQFHPEGSHQASDEAREDGKYIIRNFIRSVFDDE